jgi:hypothetical protein
MFTWMFFLAPASLPPTKLLRALDSVIVLPLFIILSISLSVGIFVVAVVTVIAVVAAAAFGVAVLLGS